MLTLPATDIRLLLFRVVCGGAILVWAGVSGPVSAQDDTVVARCTLELGVSGQEGRPRQAVKASAAPSFAAYEHGHVRPSAERDDRYLRDAVFAFDEYFGAFADGVDHALAQAEVASGDDRAHRFARIGLHLDALVPHLGRLLPYVDGPADSAELARLAEAFEFEHIAAPEDGADHLVALRVALARELLARGGFHQCDAGSTIDDFLTSFGRLRSRLRLAEAEIPGSDGPDPNDPGAGAGAALRRESAQSLTRNWREGFRPILYRTVDGAWHTPLSSRLRWHFRDMGEPHRRIER